MAQANLTNARPDPSEYAPYYHRYVSLVPGDDILRALEAQERDTARLFSTISEAQGDYRYAPDKWTLKQVIGHLIDSERIFAYRALRIARNDPNPLAGFEQDDYVRFGPFSSCRLSGLVDEFACVRHASVLLLGNLQPEAWNRRGNANNSDVSVRAIAYILAGHELHHRNIIQQKYLTG